MTTLNVAHQLDAVQRRLYVLDTNVLMHDPTALFRFEEHDIFLPMTVVEELDRNKGGMSEASRNARQASRFIDQMISEADGGGHEEGYPIALDELDIGRPTGRLFFNWVRSQDDSPSADMDLSVPDNAILNFALQLRAQHEDREVVLITKDTNLRIKASIVGMPVEDYRNDRALSDLDLLYSGVARFGIDFWERREQVDADHAMGGAEYKLSRREGEEIFPNQGVIIANGDEPAIIGLAQNIEPERFKISMIADYSSSQEVWGIHARNPEQNLALNLLMDPQVEFVSLLGGAGTGKTLLALAAGLTQVMDQKLYNNIIVTRATVSVGDEIGYLPGSEEEKMSPWMGAIHDNLEFLLNPDGSKDSWEAGATNELVSTKVKINSMSFMRGRTFLNKYIILDEAQNLTPKQMKTLITRAGPGTKIVCLGNIEQIDTPYLTETTSGLTYAVDRFKSWPYSGHITLEKGERSQLADFASSNL